MITGLGHRVAGIALVAVVILIAAAGSANGQPGDLFLLRAGGSLDWVPSSGALDTSSTTNTTAAGVLTSPYGSASYSEAAGPGVARSHVSGQFTNPAGFTQRFDPSTFTRATTRLTVSGPAGVVNVRLKAHIDATLVHTCPASFTCTNSITIFVGSQNTVVLGYRGTADPNLLGLTVDPIPNGVHVHGDYVSPPRPVTVNSPLDVQLSLQLALQNLGGFFEVSSSWDARGEVSFPAEGTVLDVPDGYTVSGENVEDNHWTDPFAPPPAPDVELRFADGSSIGPGDVLDLGSIASGATSPPATFTIANTGTGALHVQPLTAPAGFAVDDKPDGTVAPGATTTAGLTCSGTNTGTAPLVLDETVAVASDDPDEGSLDVHVRCVVLPESAPEPDIELRDDGGTPLPPPYVLDLGDVASGTPAIARYRIANVGTGQLTITDVTNEAPPGLGGASAPAAAVLPAGASTTAEVSCGGVNPGQTTLNVQFRVRIFSNDLDESPADLLVRCHVVPANPDIELRYFGDNSLVGADDVIELGPVADGADSEIVSLRVNNVGDAPLDWSASVLPPFTHLDSFGSVAPGGTSIARIRCRGGSSTQSGVYRIVSDDPDEGSISIQVRCLADRPPTLVVPGSITADATTPVGTPVTFAVSVDDDHDPAPTLLCAPSSGSMFPIGTTTVTCTAADDGGNSASASFTVTVRGAAAQIAALISATEAYVDSPAIRAVLRVTLQTSAQALAAGRKPAACVTLAAYIAAVRSLPSAFLTGAEKAELMAGATRIRAVIGC